MTTRYPDGVQEPRQRGRPKVAERMEPVTARLPVGVYDRLCQQAHGRGEPLSVIVRELLILRLPPKV